MLKPTRLTKLVHKIENRHPIKIGDGRVHFSVLGAKPKEVHELHLVARNLSKRGHGYRRVRHTVNHKQKVFCQRVVIDGMAPQKAYMSVYNCNKAASERSLELLRWAKIRKYISRLMKVRE